MYVHYLRESCNPFHFTDALKEVKCPAGSPQVGCSFVPCEKLLCDDYPQAVCMNNYCGQCKAQFFLNGKEVECSKLLF